MTHPDHRDTGDDVTTRRVALGKPARPQVDWRADTTQPRRDTVAWVPGGPPATPPRRRRRSVLVALAVAVVLVAAGVTTFLVWPDGGPAAPPARAAGASPTGTSDPAALTATDRLIRSLTVGQCLAMTDLLDDTVDPDATTVPCTDPTATFTVADVNRRMNATNPCHTEESIKSTAVTRVVCLTRFLQQDQCILGNDANQYLVSAVACTATPAAPFTQVLRIAQYRQGGTPLTCTAPLLLVTATPGRSMCLAKVR